MVFKLDRSIVEEACKGIIETILYCLPNAFKGTAYLIGPPPELRAQRVTSGVISPDRTTISWGLPQSSDYNPPGKTWMEYRDEPHRALEAMGWCVERQKSWTAEDPSRDTRSVNLQIDGTPEDSHHMEPVLVRKTDLYPNGEPVVEYPENYQGETIWQGSEYVVVAVIKIHFYPYTIRIGSAETKVIKKLSRILGTELLSHSLVKQALETVKGVAEQRLYACNTLAHTIRNAITKSGLILSLLKLELGFLRMQYEEILTDGGKIAPTITTIANKIEKMLITLSLAMPEHASNLEKIIFSLRRLKSYFIRPDATLEWIEAQIINKWNFLVSAYKDQLNSYHLGRINQLMDELKHAALLPQDPELSKRALFYIPDHVKEKFVNIIYSNSIENSRLDELIEILEGDNIPLPFLEKSRRSLIHLRALLEVIRDLEITSNKAISEIRSGEILK
jgi:hypothetical protein